jgi:hypothetical protein
MLVESAWTYRHPPRVGAKKLYLLEQTTPKVREIAWKAQSRLTGRYRTLSANGKKTTVVCTAVARELAASCGQLLGRCKQPEAAQNPRAQAGVGPRQGNIRHPLCGRHRRRPL